jgi:hypothetical protein
LTSLLFVNSTYSFALAITLILVFQCFLYMFFSFEIIAYFFQFFCCYFHSSKIVVRSCNCTSQSQLRLRYKSFRGICNNIKTAFAHLFTALRFNA